MKKMIAIFSCALVFAGCSKTAVENIEDENLRTSEPQGVVMRCASEEVLQQQLKADPSLRLRMEAIEEARLAFERNPAAARLLADGTIEIPVVVNVLYKTAAQNISLAQIQSQIDVLNKDYAATNTDITKVPTIFQGVKAGDVGIRFVLDQVIRKSTTKTSWGTNDAMKKNSGGGLSPTSPTTKLNMWCCNLSGGILGYAQFPGGSSATDGVVIDDNAFGVTTAGAPYNKGRTATHEVGHWLNLRHIWGDAQCGNDLVGDTPLHTGANYGCPASGAKSTCSGTPVMMTMNYMDYTDDLCMYMFSAGQKTRMKATFASGGGRNSFAQ
ncbi:zinc metalloprotease [Ferruginibacter sp. HRS2-29]|uniref:zinc metalloprotease n=1 Tax=Ferruginibacter sp. HRS2-29 TaxID=2487334 RepID=UPI0020CDBB5D|nr:zinc metalloprotease [Ferruginibacter sp. HRS2-29]MCP9751686.1 zinc metalloprotease [Ferruginibacter sp. HRS2-29]